MPAKKSQSKAAPRPMNKSAMKKVKGGQITQDITVNKAKTADKAFSAMDAYIRG